MQAVIFDLDGTLADTLEDIAQAANYALGLHGLPELDSAKCRKLIGDGAAALVARIAPQADERLQQKLLDDFRTRYFAHMLDQTRPYDGIEPLLDELSQRDVPLAVLSNKPHVATTEIIVSLFPDVPFRAVVGQQPGSPHKPDPTTALQLAETIGVAAGACWLVGDTPVDMQTASNAGMRPVGVSWGLRDRAELLAHGAVAILDRPAQLLELLGSE